MTLFSRHYPLPLRALILPFIDLLSASLAVVLSWLIARQGAPIDNGTHVTWYTLASVVLFWTVGAHLVDGYNPIKIRVPSFHFEVVGKVTGLFFTAAFILMLFFGFSHVPIGCLLVCMLLVPLIVLTGRSVGTVILHLPRFQRNVIIIGAGWAGRTINREIESRPAYGYRTVGFLDRNAELHGEVIDGIPVLGCDSRLLEVLVQTGTDFVVVAVTHGAGSELTSRLYRARHFGVSVVRMTDMYEMLTQRVPVEHLPEQWVNEFVEEMSESYEEDGIPRRLLNILLGSMFFLISLPFLPLIVLLILITDGRPVFFVQERPGKNEKLFKLYKFRTMVSATEDDDEGSIGNSWVERITPTGKFLRVLRLDELPQFFNVIKGDINLVGPRPFITSEVAVLSERVPYYNLRFLVKPGLTGHAQLMAGYENDPETALKKLEYDLFYIKYRSIWFDLLVILRTIPFLLSRKGE